MKSLFLITDRQCHLYCIFYSIKYLNNDISCYSETEDNWWCWNGTLGSYIATPGLSLKSSRVSWEIQVQIQSLKVAFSLSEYSIWNIQKCRLRLEISKIVDCLYRQTYIYIYIYIYDILSPCSTVSSKFFPSISWKLRTLFSCHYNNPCLVVNRVFT